MKGDVHLTHLMKELYVDYIKTSDDSVRRSTIKKWAKKKWKRHFTKEGKQIANWCMKMCSTPLCQGNAN